MGLPVTSNLGFSAGSATQEFRATVINPTEDLLDLVMNGPGRSRRWQLKGGEVVHLFTPLQVGDYHVSASPQLFLATPRLAVPKARTRQLVLVIVDTLRNDHVTPELTPSILSAFRNGARWTNITANCSWTLPSVASFLTSRPVLELTPPDGDLAAIPEEFTTFAELLAKSGFISAGVVANYAVHVRNGFAKGFESFFLPDGKGDLSDYPDASEVVQKARRWLSSHTGEDVFLYLHFMDPHEPYNSHELELQTPPPIRELSHRGRKATPAEATVLRQLYSEEVKYLDRHLGPFLNELPDDAVVALSADHGEALGERDCWGHGYNLFQEVLSVPLLIRSPGIRPQETAHPRQLLDLAPTLAELVEVSPSPEMKGRSLLTEPPGYPMVSVTFGSGPMRWTWRNGNHKVVVRTQPQPGLGIDKRSTMKEQRPLPTGAFLYDLDLDPAEQDPVSLPEEWALPAAQVFASTAGHFIPGLHLFTVGVHEPVKATFKTPASLKLVQLWSSGPIKVTKNASTVTVDFENGFPFSAMAWTVKEMDSWIEPGRSSASWIGIKEGIQTPIRSLNLSPDKPGISLWLNSQPATNVVVEEGILEKLKALGYIG